MNPFSVMEVLPSRLAMLRPLALVGSVLLVSACDGRNRNTSSSSVPVAVSSSSLVSSAPVSSSLTSSSMISSSVLSSSLASSLSSSSLISSSVISSSSSVAPSSSSVSSNAVSSSSQAGNAGPIIPRTSCPTPPPEPQYGAWEPHFAEVPGNTRDTVKDYLTLMAKQPNFTATGTTLPWNMYEPAAAQQNPGQKYPLVIYLHGGAEMGKEGEPGKHLENRHAKNFFASSNSLLTVQNRERFPAYIVAPHCDCSFGSNEWASGGFGRFSIKEGGSGYGRAVEKLIEKLIAEKQVDPARIYVTGTSMGGGGSWDLAARRPDLIAAAIPLAGHSLSDNSLKPLIDNKVPVWSNHGEGDENNPISAAQAAVDSIRQQGGCAWISRYPTYAPLSKAQATPKIDPADTSPADLYHTVWPRAYTNPDLWPWVFAQAQPRAGQALSSAPSSSSVVATSSSVRSSLSSVASVSSLRSSVASSVSSTPFTGKPISQVVFASQDLKRCVEMTGASTTDQVTTLACGQQIADWAGLEDLGALRSLRITGGYYNNPLVLKGAAQLETLIIDGPDIGSLDIRSATGLKNLEVLKAGRLKVVDTSAQAFLDLFKATSSGITSLNLANNSRLTQVTVTGSKVGCTTLTEIAYLYPNLAVQHGLASCSLMPPSGDNHLNARRASIAPVVDGIADPVWDTADWELMDQSWTFENMKPPSSPDDLSVRFKMLWDEDYLYLLVDVTDDIIGITGEYWQKDTVEIFIDEDRSGGSHQSNNNAFAYHISFDKKVVDIGDVTGHVDVQITSNAANTRHLWEIRMKVFGDYGNGNGNEIDARRKLYAGKIMGFTPSVIDNDRNGGREHFVSSVFTEGHNKNQGYINADSFGSLMLVE